MQKEGKARRLTYFCAQIGTLSLQKEGKAGRLTYFCAQIGTVSLQKEGKARRLTYFCGRSPSGRKTDAKQILVPGYDRTVPPGHFATDFRLSFNLEALIVSNVPIFAPFNPRLRS